MSLKNVEDAFALSPIQSGMLYDCLSAPDSDVYVTYLTSDVVGAVDCELLKQAWHSVYSMHQALRAEFHWDGLDQPLQVIAREVSLPWKVLDWSDSSELQHEDMIRELIASERLERIDISSAPLSRFILVKLQDKFWKILWCVHHLLADGVSTPTILEQVMECYAILQQKKDPIVALNTDSIYQYSRYIHWLGTQNTEIANDYWQNRLLNSTPTPMRLRPITPSESATVADDEIPQIKFGLNPVQTDNIAQFCQANHLTLSTFLHGAWALLVREYSGCEHSLYASTVSGRHSDIDGMQNAVGLYLNAQPRWIETTVEMGIIDWLRDIQADIHRCAKFDYSPLNEIQKFINRDSSTDIFESIITIGAHPGELDLSPQSRDFTFTNISSHLTQSHYKLAFLAFPGNTLEMSLVYNPKKFRTIDMERMSHFLLGVIDEMMATRESTPDSISKKVAAKMTDSISESINFPDQAETVHQWFESVVDKQPHDIAIRFNGEAVTFAQLEARANQIARQVLSIDRSTNTVPIGLMLPRGVEQIAAMLGILKASAAYIPIDPEYPPSTIQTLLETAGIEHVVTDDRLAPTVQAYSVEPLLVHESVPFNSGRLSGMQGETQDLAYVMFTSGSTGVPKGVQITHSNLVYSTTARIDFYRNPKPVYLLLSSISFDSSVAGIYWCLCGGGTLVLPLPNEEKDIDEIAQIIQREAITHTLCLPSYYQLLLNQADHALVKGLEVVIVAGEECSSELVKLHFDRPSTTRLFNEYGPTEACVWSSVYEFDGPVSLNAPIGKPIGNTYLQVINEHGNPCPRGCEGEIVIGGSGVSPGYLNDHELTCAKFVANPVVSSNASVIYKTGDLGFINSDGDLVFTGRVDRQLKIRGHRIEPGEVEAALNEHADISKSVVVATSQSRFDDRSDTVLKADRRMLLVAYYLPRNISTGKVASDASSDRLSCNTVEGVEERTLRNYCQSKLPAHMCPTRFVALDRFPVLPNGKLSYSHLPTPQQTKNAQLRIDEAPVSNESVTATRMVAILAELLDMADVRSDDNFFEIGGDSITAIQFLSKARQSGLTIDLTAISQSNTIADMATLCEAAQPDQKSSLADEPERSNMTKNFSASGLDDNELDDFLQSFD